MKIILNKIINPCHSELVSESKFLCHSELVSESKFLNNISKHFTNSIKKSAFSLFSILLLLILSNISAYSQGFDWQFSSRFQNLEPKYFFGLNLEYGLVNSFGDIPYNEGSFSCCNFDDGNGSNFKLGLTGEYWLDGLTAINANVNYSSINSFFSIQRKIPRREYMLVTNYELDATANFINTNFFVKRRVPNSNFYGGIGLDFNIYLNKSLNFQELKDSQTPKDDPFQNRYNIANAEISEFNTVNFGLILLLGYDLSLTDGYYLSSSIGLNLPVISILSDSDWRIFGTKLKMSILRKF